MSILEASNRKAILTPKSVEPAPARPGPKERPGARDLFRLPTSAIAELEKEKRVEKRQFGLIAQCAPISASPARERRPPATAGAAMRRPGTLYSGTIAPKRRPNEPVQFAQMKQQNFDFR